MNTPSVSEETKSSELVASTKQSDQSHEQTGIALIARERSRQIEKEGWSAKHDEEHATGELLRAALAYGWQANKQVQFGFPITTYLWDFPWGKKWWKPSADPIRNLEKAGALIAAEIDRLLSAQGEPLIPSGERSNVVGVEAEGQPTPKWIKRGESQAFVDHDQPEASTEQEWSKIKELRSAVIDLLDMVRECSDGREGDAEGQLGVYDRLIEETAFVTSACSLLQQRGRGEAATPTTKGQQSEESGSTLLEKATRLVRTVRTMQVDRDGESKLQPIINALCESRVKEAHLASETPTPQSDVANEETGLAPCPLCGSQADTLDCPIEDGRVISVFCGNVDDCGAEIEEVLGEGATYSLDNLKERWNRRVPLVPTPAIHSTAPKETKKEEESASAGNAAHEVSSSFSGQVTPAPRPSDTKDIGTQLAKEIVRHIRVQCGYDIPVEHEEAIAIRIDDTVASESSSVAGRLKKAQEAIKWALGEHNTDGFRERYAGDPPYWWRRELRERAGLYQAGERSPSDTGLLASAKSAGLTGAVTAKLEELVKDLASATTPRPVGVVATETGEAIREAKEALKFARSFFHEVKCYDKKFFIDNGGHSVSKLCFHALEALSGSGDRLALAEKQGEAKKDCATAHNPEVDGPATSKD